MGSNPSSTIYLSCDFGQVTKCCTFILYKVAMINNLIIIKPFNCGIDTQQVLNKCQSKDSEFAWD